MGEVLGPRLASVVEAGIADVGVAQPLLNSTRLGGLLGWLGSSSSGTGSTMSGGLAQQFFPDFLFLLPGYVSIHLSSAPTSQAQGVRDVEQFTFCQKVTAAEPPAA